MYFGHFLDYFTKHLLTITTTTTTTTTYFHQYPQCYTFTFYKSVDGTLQAWLPTLLGERKL